MEYRYLLAATNFADGVLQVALEADESLAPADVIHDTSWQSITALPISTVVTTAPAARFAFATSMPSAGDGERCSKLSTHCLSRVLT